MLSLSRHQLDLWFVFPREINDPILLARYQDLLSPQEHQRRQRLRFAVDQDRFLVTRAAVRDVLSRYVAVAPQDWIFCENAHGKPALATAKMPWKVPTLAFNLSHSNGLIVIGVTSATAIGVDVEDLPGKTVALDLLSPYFSAQEIAELRSLPKSMHSERFLRHWTLKEAYVKACGMGIATAALDKVSFQFTCGEVVASMQELDGFDRQHERNYLHHPDHRHDVELNVADSMPWQFLQWMIGSSHLLGVCLARDIDFPPTELIVGAKKFVPLVEEGVLQIALLGKSQHAFQHGDSSLRHFPQPMQSNALSTIVE